MAPVIKLLGPAWSRAFRCIWMLEELGLNYEHVSSAMPATRTARNFNPSGKIPVLLEYDCAKAAATPGSAPSFVLSESAAINTYLADVYGGNDVNGGGDGNEKPQLVLVPKAGTRERARYDEAICCILSELDAQGLWIHRKHQDMGRFFGTIPEAVSHAKEHFQKMNRTVATKFILKKNGTAAAATNAIDNDNNGGGGPYLLGKHFTAADIMYVHCLDWAKSIGWRDADIWSELGLDSYHEMCQQRKAYQRAKKIRDNAPPPPTTTKKKNKQKNKSSL